MSYVCYLHKLNYAFIKPPLIVGGHAMSYYNIRKPGHDLDIVVSLEDWKCLKNKYPDKINLFGGMTEDDVDATLNLDMFDIDIIKTLWLHNYDELCSDSVNGEGVKFISIPKLLYIKSFPSFRHSDEKSTKDIELIIEHIIKQKNNN